MGLTYFPDLRFEQPSAIVSVPAAIPTAMNGHHKMAKLERWHGMNGSAGILARCQHRDRGERFSFAVGLRPSRRNERREKMMR